MKHSITTILPPINQRNEPPFIQINNAYATATISLLGGQVVAYQPHGAPPVLWLSSYNPYQKDDLNRGGIPICWPWLGLQPDDKTAPLHGVVRRDMWELVTHIDLPNGTTEIVLRIRDSETSRAVWAHLFELNLTIIISNHLELRLTAQNRGTQPWTMGGAFHSYLHVADVRQIEIQGLAGATYWDAVQDSVQEQKGELVIREEVDRVYLFSAETTLHDPIYQRNIHIHKQNSNTTVIWNPDRTTKHSYIAADDYQHFVCIETAKYGEDRVTLQPGASFTFGTVIHAEAWIEKSTPPSR